MPISLHHAVEMSTPALHVTEVNDVIEMFIIERCIIWHGSHAWHDIIMVTN